MVYNRTLLQYIKDHSKDSFLTFEITAWPSWLHKIYSHRELDMNHIKDFKYIWDEIEACIDSLNLTNYEYVISDEGQNMPIPLLKIINKFSNNLFYFADHNQSVIDKKTQLDEITNSVKNISNVYHLTNNFRNTKQIYEVAELLLSVHKVNAPIIEGPKPIILKTHEKK